MSNEQHSDWVSGRTPRDDEWEDEVNEYGHEMPLDEWDDYTSEQSAPVARPRPTVIEPQAPSAPVLPGQTRLGSGELRHAETADYDTSSTLASGPAKQQARTESVPDDDRSSGIGDDDEADARYAQQTTIAGVDGEETQVSELENASSEPETSVPESLQSDPDDHTFEPHLDQSQGEIQPFGIESPDGAGTETLFAESASQEPLVSDDWDTAQADELQESADTQVSEPEVSEQAQLLEPRGDMLSQNLRDPDYSLVEVPETHQEQQGYQVMDFDPVDQQVSPADDGTTDEPEAADTDAVNHGATVVDEFDTFDAPVADEVDLTTGLELDDVTPDGDTHRPVDDLDLEQTQSLDEEPTHTRHEATAVLDDEPELTTELREPEPTTELREPEPAAVYGDHEPTTVLDDEPEPTEALHEPEPTAVLDEQADERGALDDDLNRRQDRAFARPVADDELEATQAVPVIHEPQPDVETGSGAAPAAAAAVATGGTAAMAGLYRSDAHQQDRTGTTEHTGVLNPPVGEDVDREEEQMRERLEAERRARAQRLGVVSTAEGNEYRDTRAKPKRTTDKFFGSLGLFLLRLVTAVVLGVTAYSMLSPVDTTQQILEPTLIVEPRLVSWITGFTLAAVSILLVLGLLQRLVGLVVIVYAVAVLAFLRWGAFNPFGENFLDALAGDKELLLAGIGVVLLTLGGGGWGIDGWIRRSRARAKAERMG